jgi:hypothetical protein
MSLRKPLVEFPAAIESSRRHRMATNETRQPTIGNSAHPISGSSKEGILFSTNEAGMHMKTNKTWTK